MKPRLLTILALNSALCLAPLAMAQQGPAGVPGAPLLGAEIAPPPPVPIAAPKPVQPPEPEKNQVTEKCRNAKDVKRCEERQAHQAKRAEAREACKKQPKNKRKQCIERYPNYPAKKKK